MLSAPCNIPLANIPIGIIVRMSLSQLLWGFSHENILVLKDDVRFALKTFFRI